MSNPRYEAQSVTSVGADNTGGAPADAAIQKLIDVMVAQGSGSVWVPDGDFKISTGLTVSPATGETVRLSGPGKLVLDSTATVGAMLTIGGAGRVVVDGLTLDGGATGTVFGATTACAGVTVTTGPADLVGLQLTNVPGDGVVTAGDGVTVKDCRLSGCKRNGIRVSGGARVKLQDNEILDTVGVGVACHATSDVADLTVKDNLVLSTLATYWTASADTVLTMPGEFYGRGLDIWAEAHVSVAAAATPADPVVSGVRVTGNTFEHRHATEIHDVAEKILNQIVFVSLPGRSGGEHLDTAFVGDCYFANNSVKSNILTLAYDADSAEWGLDGTLGQFTSTGTRYGMVTVLGDTKWRSEGNVIEGSRTLLSGNRFNTYAGVYLVGANGCDYTGLDIISASGGNTIVVAGNQEYTYYADGGLTILGSTGAANDGLYGIVSCTYGAPNSTIVLSTSGLTAGLAEDGLLLHATRPQGFIHSPVVKDTISGFFRYGLVLSGVDSGEIDCTIDLTEVVSSGDRITGNACVLLMSGGGVSGEGVTGTTISGKFTGGYSSVVMRSPVGVTLDGCTFQPVAYVSAFGVYDAEPGSPIAVEPSIGEMTSATGLTIRNCKWLKSSAVYKGTGKYYRCLKAHIADTDNTPETGDYWDDYWVECTGFPPASLGDSSSNSIWSGCDRWYSGEGYYADDYDESWVTYGDIVSYDGHYWMCMWPHVAADGNRPGDRGTSGSTVYKYWQPADWILGTEHADILEAVAWTATTIYSSCAYKCAAGHLSIKSTSDLGVGNQPRSTAGSTYWTKGSQRSSGGTTYNCVANHNSDDGTRDNDPAGTQADNFWLAGDGAVGTGIADGAWADGQDYVGIPWLPPAWRPDTVYLTLGVVPIQCLGRSNSARYTVVDLTNDSNSHILLPFRFKGNS